MDVELEEDRYAGARPTGSGALEGGIESDVCDVEVVSGDDGVEGMIAGATVVVYAVSVMEIEVVDVVVVDCVVVCVVETVTDDGGPAGLTIMGTALEDC